MIRAMLYGTNRRPENGDRANILRHTAGKTAHRGNSAQSFRDMTTAVLRGKEAEISQPLLIFSLRLPLYSSPGIGFFGPFPAL